MVLSERAAHEAAKREELRICAREQIRALEQTIGVLDRCIRSSELATGAQLRAVERAFENASIHVLKMADEIGHAGQLLKVTG